MSTVSQGTTTRSMLLVCEDERVCEALRDVFAVYPFRIAIAESIRDALRELKGQRPCDVLVASVSLGPVVRDVQRLMRLVRSGRFCSPGLPMVVVAEDGVPPIVETLAHEHGASSMCLRDGATRLRETVLAAIRGRVKPAVLVIEDDVNSGNLARLALKDGYVVNVAMDGASGLEMWQREHHDLVLLDLMLPDMAGSDVLEKILETDAHQAVVVLSAYATLRCHEELMVRGASEVLPKPVNLNVLRHTCDRILRQAQYEAECHHVEATNNKVDDLTQKVWAVQDCLARGETARAVLHVADVAGDVAQRMPSDDQWASLLLVKDQ